MQKTPQKTAKDPKITKRPYKYSERYCRHVVITNEVYRILRLYQTRAIRYLIFFYLIYKKKENDKKKLIEVQKNIYIYIYTCSYIRLLRGKYEHPMRIWIYCKIVYRISWSLNPKGEEPNSYLLGIDFFFFYSLLQLLLDICDD